MKKIIVILFVLSLSIGVYAEPKMKWTPPKDFREVQITLEEIYKLLNKNGKFIETINNEVSTIKNKIKTIEVFIPDEKDVKIDDFGDLVDQNNETVVLPQDSLIFRTKAQQMIPSSYFIDLRGYVISDTQKRFTSEYLSLHDSSSPWNVIGVTNVDITIDVTVAGPIPNGRDQSDVFPHQSWVHFYAYWDESLQVVKGLASASSTAPLLPNKSIYFMRISSSLFISSPGDRLLAHGQIGNKIWHPTWLLYDNAPAIADTWEQISLSINAPPTAKSLFGYFGNSTNCIVVRGMGIATNSDGNNDHYNTLQIGAPISGYYIINATFFNLPLDGQYIYWKASVTNAYFAIRSLGYEDDL